MTTYLGRYFTTKEFELSNTALRNGLDNTMDSEAFFAAQDLVQNILDPMRLNFGPILITSGYRSRALNKLVGGASKSYHTKGMAADIVMLNPCISLRHAMEWVHDTCEYTELIWEFGRWLHIAYDPSNTWSEPLEAYKTKTGRTRYRAIGNFDELPRSL